MKPLFLLICTGLFGCQSALMPANGPDPAASLDYSDTASVHPAAKRAPVAPTDELADVLPDSLPIGDFIRLERGPCFGHCPVFQATLHQNGMLELQEPKRPLQQVQRTPQHFLQLARLLEQANVLRFQRHYDPSNRTLCPTYRTDHPSTHIQFRIQGQTHAITHYHGCVGLQDETALLQLETQLEQAMQLPLATALH